MKLAHPALSFDKATLRRVQVGQDVFDVWMVPNIDHLLEEFIATGQQDPTWNEQRCPFGAVLWPSARALWQWLNEDVSRYSKYAANPSDHQFRVIELGCGVGFLSALFASRTHWELTATDYEPAYAKYVEANTRLHAQNKVHFETLDWSEQLPTHLAGVFDLVVACDVFYDDSHIDTLPQLAAKLLKPNGSMLLADPERFRFTTAIETLANHFERMDVEQFSVENSPEDSGASGVINADQKFTSVQIIHCQIPRI
jgi:2-polyprenyl-3-methyl-5-hydroxy-6-metoxy-1,4-benzoquinol methylase